MPNSTLPSSVIGRPIDAYGEFTKFVEFLSYSLSDKFCNFIIY